MVRACPLQDVLTSRIEGALGAPLGRVSCYVVDSQGMDDVLRKSGWADEDRKDVVGFQRGENIYVLDSAPWTVLHELVHRTGINADTYATWVGEGLTSAIAGELATGPHENRPTYPHMERWVRERLLPATGHRTAVDLGRWLLAQRDGRDALSRRIAERTGGSLAKIRAGLRPQASEKPALGSATKMMGYRDRSTRQAVGFLVATVGILMAASA